MKDTYQHLDETPLDSTQVFKGKLLDVRRDRVSLPDGNEGIREYVVHPGAVVIIAELDDGRPYYLNGSIAIPCAAPFLSCRPARSMPVKRFSRLQSVSYSKKPDTARVTGGISASCIHASVIRMSASRYFWLVD